MSVCEIRSAEDLELCPVCHHQAQLRESKHRRYSDFCVECKDGKCRFKTPWLQSKNEAVTRWNRRKPAVTVPIEEKLLDAPTAAELEKVVEAVEFFNEYVRQRSHCEVTL